MAKIFLNTRDHLVVVDTNLIAAVQADGNYCDIVYINKHRITVALTISRLETLLKTEAEHGIFLRLGRSLIINHAMLYSIDTQKQEVLLSKDGVSKLRIRLSKRLVKTYKAAVVQDINNQQSTHRKS